MGSWRPVGQWQHLPGFPGSHPAHDFATVRAERRASAGRNIRGVGGVRRFVGVGMAQGVNVGGLFDAAGIERQPEGALEGGAAHGFGGGGGTLGGARELFSFGAEPNRTMIIQGLLFYRRYWLEFSLQAVSRRQHAKA